MLFCVIKNCKNSQGSVKLNPNRKISFHSFPTNYEILTSWIKIVRKSLKQKQWVPSTTSVICSDHFAENKLYEISNGCRKVRRGTLPTKLLSISSPASSADEDEDLKIESVMKDSINDISNDSSIESDDSEDLLTMKNKKKSKENRASELSKSYANVEFANLCNNLEDVSDSQLYKNKGLIQVKTEPITKLRASGFYITHMYVGEESNDTNGQKANKKNKSNKKRATLSDEGSSASDADSTIDTPTEYALKKKLKKKNAAYKKSCNTIKSLKKQIQQLKSSKEKLSETVRSFKSKKCKCFNDNKSNVDDSNDSDCGSDIKNESTDEVNFEVSFVQCKDSTLDNNI